MDAVLGTALGVVDPFRASDGVLLHRRVWEPVGSPRGDLLLGHGIGDSLSRYTYAARAFAEGGRQSQTGKDMLSYLGDPDVDFVKLDAEGMETEILRGGSTFFARESPIVLCEITHAGQTQPELIEAFAALGAWMFLGETVSPQRLLGIGVIMVGVPLLARS